MNLNKYMELYPFVSIATPTFNRRPFIEKLIQIIETQDYPKEKLEWVIVDDGTDAIEDLIKNINFINVNYKYVEKPSDKIMTLGLKRNMLNQMCKGDFIVYFDDDDYYPPNKISYSIKAMHNNPDFLIGGSSIMNIYFPKINKLYQSGPYGQFHATAATFIFKKELLLQTSFNDDDLLGEEKQFLKNYSIPLLQLEPKNVILVIAHSQNSFDKYKLLDNMENNKITETKYNLQDFIKKKECQLFYSSTIHNLLNNYELGISDNKKEIKELIDKKEKKREEIISNIKKYKDTIISCPETNNHYEEKLKKKSLLIQKLLEQVKMLKSQVEEKDIEIKLLKEKLNII